MKGQSKRIGLIDCNNFFVSCERLFRPDLLGVPVVVLSSNDGCIVARSQEIKDMNVPMGVPYFQVKDTLEKAGTVIFSGHIALYRDISSRVMDVVREQMETVEQYSIDEAFFTLPDDESALDCAQTLKERVEREVGIPVSVGVATSKTLAKHAAQMAKKRDGLCVLNNADWQSLAGEVSLEQIWGVGAGMARRFRGCGLHSVADFIAVPSNQVANLFGVNGVRLQSELMGCGVYQVKQKRDLQKSLMNSRSFSKVTNDLHILLDAQAYHTRQIAAELRSMGAACTTMRVSLQTSRHGDFFLRGGSKEITFSTPTADTLQLVSEGEKLVRQLYETDVPYQKIGVTVSGIVPQITTPLTLFDYAQSDSHDNDALYVALDSVNKRAGKELVTVGSRLQTHRWQSKSEKRSPAYTTRWDDIATVSAKTTTF